MFSFLDECQVDRDCPFSKACVSHECIDPCLNKICGRNAECRVESHQAFCFCPNGLQGNPENFCIEVGCRTDSDCSFDEKCDRVQSFSQTRECTRLCLRNPCAVGATCTAQNHREICACNPPLTGDGYTQCREPPTVRPEPECRIDEDCPSRMACIAETCQNPCRVANPCTGSQKCQVTDTLPTRTVSCVCPQGFVFGSNGDCKQGMILENKLIAVISLKKY